jgi:hypothetical protein
MIILILVKMVWGMMNEISAGIDGPAIDSGPIGLRVLLLLLPLP